MMLKVSKITIENFRGIKLPLQLEFKKGNKHTSTLLYGRNGTGKSSIVDAWEWLHNFKIESLNKEGVSALDYPHKSSQGKDSSIFVEFNHPEINSTKVTFNPEKINTPLLTGEYNKYKELCRYPNFLRYSDLQDFVFKSKTEKYKYIGKFFGLEKFLKNQADFLTLINRVKTKLNENQKKYETAGNAIKVLLKEPELDITSINDTTIIEVINNICANHKFPLITDFKESKIIYGKLKALIFNNPKTKELTEWKNFQIKVNQFYPLQPLKNKFENLESIFKELKQEEQNITKIILADLYKTSISVLNQLPNKNQCPVCDKIYDGDLFVHLNSKSHKLADLNKKSQSYEKLKKEIEGIINETIKKISFIHLESENEYLKDFTNFFKILGDFTSNTSLINTTLKKQLLELENIDLSKSLFIENLDKIINNEASVKSFIANTIKKLEEDPARKSLADDYKCLIDVTKNYYEYNLNKKKVEKLLVTTKNLESLYSQLTNFIQHKIQVTFTSISDDLVECFNILEENNQYIKNPLIKLLEGKDKAIELEIEFASEKVTPAFKFLSESQINSFGLAIFLSSVKLFNNGFKFFILDDVVNSFDNFKRPKLLQLLANRFADFQILILTHDQIFFDYMQKAFPEWNRYRFTNWDYSTGPRYRLSKNYYEEIKDFLDEDKPIQAGQALGRYLEWTLGQINESIKTQIQYKIENIYTLSELFDPFKSRILKQVKQTGKTHIINSLLEQLAGNIIFRNYCAHWKNESSQFTSQEIELIFNLWIKIEDLIYCKSCKSFVKLENNNLADFIRCGCKYVDLKSELLYT